MSLKLGKYLSEVRKGADKFQRIDINGNIDDKGYKIWLPKLVLSLISIALFFLIRDGFDKEFVSFASTTLSILIGLFITAVIFSFDKFYQPLDDEEEADAWEKVINTQAFNYSKQFAYITGYNIILCIFTLLLLALSSLFPDASKINVLNLYWDLNKIGFEQIALFFTSVLFILQRFFVLYWLLRIVYNTLFVVSSMVKFMIDKIDRQ